MNRIGHRMLGSPVKTAILLIAIVYLPIALYFERSFVDPRPKGRVVAQILGPYVHEAGHAFRGAVLPVYAAQIDDKADNPTVEHDHSSSAEIYEDSHQLGPGHSTFEAIQSLGAGRFSHLPGKIIFSSSDASDPNISGHKYWIVLP
ncbi:hypothetical protein CT676_09675 [Bradyrhizobium sp. MOS001]|uniref:hypothetical protein n=1 Tax=Bradyrhizobium sp. MOS001 TaxID=2133948 RepID=UPI001074AA33|nr:hypothetical protein [Bradyrhizobium sp. MOS001]TFW61142.1 hypothetical protein CT676_09675 [Bradyrhizobium sp. MOS001]